MGKKFGKYRLTVSALYFIMFIMRDKCVTVYKCLPLLQEELDVILGCIAGFITIVYQDSGRWN